MCEKKSTGRCNVSEDILQEYRAGGSRRETLEMAMLESIARYGTDRRQYNKVKATQGVGQSI